MNFLFCGHDFKFLTPVINHVTSRPNVDVRIQQVKGHQLKPDEIAEAEENNAWADIVFCEWALGNAVWFSQHKRSGQLLVVRMHAQEFHAGQERLKAVHWQDVDFLIVICAEGMCYALNELRLPKEKVKFVYNPLDISARFNFPRGAYSDYVLGFLGMVPWMKRLDIAVDIFKRTRTVDSSFTLRIKGKRPEEYPWMAKRTEEMEKYESVYADIADSPVKNAIHFDGFDPEPGRWYSNCGFILSTSDYEGSHQSVAEGMAQGCIPIVRNWAGAKDAYPAECVWETPKEAVSLICEFRRSPAKFYAMVQKSREWALEKYDAHAICLAYDELFANHKGWLRVRERFPNCAMCIAQIVWIPPGERNGYRVRVSKFSEQYHRLGFRTVIICLHNGKHSAESLAEHCRELEELGCHAYAVAVQDFFALKFTAVQEQTLVKDLLPILERERVDVIQAHAIYCARVANILKKARPETLFSTVFHGVAPEETEMSGSPIKRVRMLENLEREVMANVDFANFVSHAMGAHYIAKYGILKTSCVVPSGLRSEALRKNFTHRDILNLPKGRPILGYVGTMVAWQCKDEMFKLFGEMHRRYPDVFFAILTPTPHQPITHELLAKNGIPEHDYLVTEVPFDDVSKAVSQFNAGVMLRKLSPVNQAASPTKFGEMVAAGVPMVATDGIGDYSEDVRQNDFGFIVPLSELNAMEFSDETCASIKRLLDERRNENPVFVERTQEFCEKNLIWEKHVTNMAGWYWRLKNIKVDGSKEPLPRGNEGFESRMLRKIDGMPKSNGCRYYERFKTKIGIICDEFYWDSVKDAADFVYLSCDDWKEKIRDIEVLYLVTAWHGLKNDDWLNLSREGTPKRQMVYDMIAQCKKRGIPTVFYSKEDPPNYDRFVGIAQHCDHVFTSCEEVIPKYVKDCGHKRVYSMCFGINPVEHNPIGAHFREKEKNVIFSGSWMMKYPHRCEALEKMFDGVLASGREINIVDRNYGNRGNSAYAYPERFRRYQSPAIGHENLQRIHRLYDWAININSVQDSRTMFANRVYELQACGNLLISNDSLGVREKFPGVFIVKTPEEVSKILSEMSPEEVRRRQLAGIRRVMTGETCFDRIAYMLTKIGIKTDVTARKALVIAKELTPAIKKMFDQQTYAAKTLMVEKNVTDAIKSSFDILAFFDPQQIYDQFYLEDMINAFKYTDCDFVSAGCGRAYSYVQNVADEFHTVFWRRASSRSRGVVI